MADHAGLGQPDRRATRCEKRARHSGTGRAFAYGHLGPETQLPIATSVPGMQFTDLMPHTARVADKLSVIRSMWHDKAGANGHPDGTQYILSGSHPNSPLEMPDIGCIVTKLLGSECRELPPY